MVSSTSAVKEVSAGLISTSRAPFAFASSGNVETGATSPEVPTINMTSHLVAASTARLKTR